VVPRKNRPVLFEVVARTLRSRGRLLSPRATPASPPPPVPLPAAPPVPLSPPAPIPTLRPRPKAKVDHGQIGYADGHVHVNLSWVHLAVVAVLALVVLFVAFQAGRQSSRPAARGQDVTESLGNTPRSETPTSETPGPAPNPGRSGNVVTPLNPPPGNDAARSAARGNPPQKQPQPAATEAFTFATDAYYVVVQHFQISKQQAAQEAGRYLIAQGIPCVVYKGRGEWMLVATEPFVDESQAKPLITRVRELGVEYAKSGGGYNFAGARAVKSS
jgi:hypothetical protein